jgi:hypothetical protein
MSSLKKRTLRVALQAATDEMHNLQVIAVGQHGLGPGLAASNFTVPFHRHPVLFHAEPLQEGSERNWSLEVLLQSIDQHFHNE